MKKSAIEPPAIDLAKLSEILGTQDGSIVDAILATFWRTANEDIICIRRAIKQRNAAELRDLVHSAKGAAKSVAAELLADSLYSLQKASENGDWSEIPELYSVIDREMGQVGKFLDQMKV